ncbi:MAG TPA: apolipoprotein N-acyltransferase [Thermotogota bacterium]|nr:apolipoprotein N-acyltransferase [Thermotogota bacterium]HPJ88439.1 apolipoprotein N-acyltransferase [Thermotogota bacterium]HPR95394.1 apolipoprotein N-acyltransferase [Thermotogota bacterium]
MRERKIREKTPGLGKRLLFALISAALLAFSMPSMGTSVLVWFSFAILMFCLDGQKKRRGFFIAWIFGWVYYSICFWWLLPAFVREIPRTFDSFPPIVGVFLFLLAGAFVGLYFGVYGFFFTHFSRKFEKKPLLLALSSIALILFVEFLRTLPPLKFIGFRFSDALFDTTGLLQLASFGGSELLLVLVALVNVLIFISYKRHRSVKQTVIVASSLILCVYCVNLIIESNLPDSYGEDTGMIKVAGVQTMITPINKYYASEDELLSDFETFAEQVEEEQPDTDLFVLPEAYFLYDVNRYPETLHSLERLSKKTDMTVIVPHIYTLENGDYYNAAQFVDPQEGLLDKVYGKMELNPFTEYLPFEELFQFLSFLKFRNYLARGPEPVMLDVGVNAAFPICFESYFPNVFVDFKKAGADMYCVITNDGYFTHKTALDQHFRQLQIRAVETRSWMCHVSNNGITGLVDPYGRILSESVPFERNINYFDFPSVKSPDTLYPHLYEYLYLFILAFFGIILLLSFVIK